MEHRYLFQRRRCCKQSWGKQLPNISFSAPNPAFIQQRAGEAIAAECISPKIKKEVDSLIPGPLERKSRQNLYHFLPYRGSTQHPLVKLELVM